MAGKKEWLRVYDELYRLYGDCTCPLKHATPFQLLAAVMLSAQCRDDRVNQVTEKLFAVAPDPAAMAALRSSPRSVSICWTMCSSRSSSF